MPQATCRWRVNSTPTTYRRRRPPIAPGGVEYAAALCNLAEAQAQLGEDEEAEKNLIRAKQARYAATAADDPRRGYDHNSLGSFYTARRRFAEAEPEFLEALRIWETAFDSAGEFVGTAHSNLGALYSEWAGEDAGAVVVAERRRKAMEHKTRALALSRAALGERHLVAAIRLQNLAVEHFQTGAPDTAVPPQLRAAAIPRAMLSTKLIPPSHPEIAIKRAPLEHLLRAAGREADISRIDALLDAEVAEVNRIHAEWERTGVHPEVSEDEA